MRERGVIEVAPRTIKSDYLASPRALDVGCALQAAPVFEREVHALNEASVVRIEDNARAEFQKEWILLQAEAVQTLIRRTAPELGPKLFHTLEFPLKLVIR